MVIDTDCTGSCKSNYHMITATTGQRKAFHPTQTHFTLPRHIFLILGQTVFAVINVINAVYLEENKEIPMLKPLVQPVWGTKLSTSQPS